MTSAACTSGLRLVLNFHGVGQPSRSLETGEDRVWVSETEMHRILDLVSGRDDVILTCDDGNSSDHDCLLPAMLSRGLRAVFFILAGRIGQKGSMNSGQIRSLVDAGMTIGLHGWDHVSWRRLDPEIRRREFVDARSRLEDVAGRSVDLAACPFGDYGRWTVATARSLGFTSLFTSDRGWAVPDRFLIPRNSVGVGERDVDSEGVEDLLADPSIGIPVRAKRWLKRLR